jgi:hypothetical protein
MCNGDITVCNHRLRHLGLPAQYGVLVLGAL